MQESKGELGFVFETLPSKNSITNNECVSRECWWTLELEGEETPTWFRCRFLAVQQGDGVVPRCDRTAILFSRWICSLWSALR